MPREHTKQFILRLTEAEHARLKEAAELNGTTATAMIRKFISHQRTKTELEELYAKQEAGYKALAEAGGLENEDLYSSK